ncbi:hypothetical protein H1R20_g13827, partial [Candolleomyces eurysporus]
MSAAKSSSKKRKRDESPSHELTVELSRTKTGKGGPHLTPSKTQFREAKNALGDTFGTKKAKAAIRAQERNHVDISAMAGVMGHVMDSIQKGAQGLMTTDEAKEFADSNRLIPSFDATATEPGDVYPLHNIIPEAEWKALSVSAFDSTTNDKERLALLPHRSSEWKYPEARHQSTSSTKTNLLTHMFALCLKLENFAADSETLAKDLSMSTTEINQLFKTLGCKISKLTDRERTRLGIADNAAETKRAVLTAPVEFPKPRLKRKT